MHFYANINRIEDIIDFKIQETKIESNIFNWTIDTNNSLFQHSTYHFFSYFKLLKFLSYYLKVLVFISLHVVSILYTVAISWEREANAAQHPAKPEDHKRILKGF